MWALQQMVMMGLAKMKQTIQMEMVYHTGEYVTFTWTHVLSFKWISIIMAFYYQDYQCVLLKV